MIVHKCDRCGAIYETLDPLLEGFIRYKITTRDLFTTFDVELCPSCKEGLHSFLMEGEYFRAEAEKRKRRLKADQEAQTLYDKLFRRK